MPFCNVLNDDNLTIMFSRFLLVSLQIDELQSCLSQGDLEDQLEDLPHDLDEVYDRIISGIDQKYREHALKILQLIPEVTLAKATLQFINL